MKFLGFIKFIFSVFFFGALIYGGYYLIDNYVWKTISPQPTAEQKFIKEVGGISNIQSLSGSSQLDSSKPFAMLLLGVDGDVFKNDRTDTMIVAIINPNTSKISLFSVPRDLRVQIPGHKGYNKINAAFAYGGINLAAKTVGDIFNIPIEHYAIFDFNGFQDLVNAIGGVNIDVKENIKFSDRITHTEFTINKGYQKLNGIQALNYSRFRYDAEGDYGRQKRQQEVIKAIMDQSMSIRNIPNMIKIVQAINNNFTSDVSYKDYGLLAFKMRSIKGSDVSTVTLKSKPQYISGVAYVTATLNDIQSTSNQLNNLLSSDTSSSNQ